MNCAKYLGVLAVGGAMVVSMGAFANTATYTEPGWQIPEGILSASNGVLYINGVSINETSYGIQYGTSGYNGHYIREDFVADGNEVTLTIYTAPNVTVSPPPYVLITPNS